MSSSLNCQVAPNLLNECKNTISHAQPPSLNLIYSTPIIPNGSVSSIRKRKVKFTIQLTIQELLSVPYLNGVLFCKVRLCDGGHYVSYSSKKEVSNSSVQWSNDSPIQFDVKTTQFYQYTTVATSPTHDNSSQINSNNNNGHNNNFIITGYEPCLCRISVRKELRGGKSYQKLGYVDCNLTDFIYQYQLEQNQLIHIKNNGYLQSNNYMSNDEFCVNRILKEYETGSHISSKKSQQRLDNSYLKIKIKIIDSHQKSSNNMSTNVVSIDNELKKQSCSLPGSPKLKNLDSPPIAISSEDSNQSKGIKETNSSPSFRKVSITSNPMPDTITQNSPMNILINTQGFTPSHSRNSSSSTTNSTINSNNCLTIQPNAFINGHNRSCSNGSIKSNVSFDFLLKNRNKKLLEDVQSTSSSSSHVNSQAYLLANPGSFQGNTNISHEIQNSISNKLTNHSSPSILMLGSNKIDPSNSNLHIIETRVDANEIINQIESELTNRLSKSIQANI